MACGVRSGRVFCVTRRAGEPAGVCCSRQQAHHGSSLCRQGHPLRAVLPATRHSSPLCRDGFSRRPAFPTYCTSSLIMPALRMLSIRHPIQVRRSIPVHRGRGPLPRWTDLLNIITRYLGTARSGPSAAKGDDRHREPACERSWLGRRQFPSPTSPNRQQPAQFARSSLSISPIVATMRANLSGGIRDAPKGIEAVRTRAAVDRSAAAARHGCGRGDEHAWRPVQRIPGRRPHARGCAAGRGTSAGRGRQQAGAVRPGRDAAVFRAAGQELPPRPSSTSTPRRMCRHARHSRAIRSSSGSSAISRCRRGCSSRWAPACWSMLRAWSSPIST